MGTSAVGAARNGAARADSTRRRLGLVLLLCCVLVAGWAALAFARLAESRNDLALAGSLLGGGDVPEARRLLLPLRGRLLVSRRVEQGLALAEKLAGGSHPPPRLDAADLAVYPLALVLRRSLADGRFALTLELFESVDETLRSGYRVLADAARFELGLAGALGEPSAASVRALRSGLSGFERRLTETGRLREQGAARIVRDRRGRLLGWLDAGGSFAEAAPGKTGDLDWALPALAGLPRSGGARLSLDLELVALTRDALGGERGTIVVLEPHTGELLAVASDPRTAAAPGPAFLGQAREPASIAKLITASAALRAGLDLDAEVAHMSCDGSVALDEGGVLWCPAVAGRLRGLAHALAISCNSTFASLGLRLGRDAMVEEYGRFGFTAVGVGGPSLGHLRSEVVTRSELANLAVGLEVAETTPLHAALLAAVFGNGGEMPGTRFVHAVDGALGLSPRVLPSGPQAAADAAPVLEARWLPLFHDALLAVTDFGGTAARVSPAGFRAAMKTGTASEPGLGFHGNYIGVAPMPEPRYAFSIRITDRRTSLQVRRSALHVTRRFLERLAEYDHAARGLPPR